MSIPLNIEIVNISAKVIDHKNVLDEALLRCGKFQEAAASMLSWLVDVESMQTNQKPFAIDFRSLRSQIQVQQVILFVVSDLVMVSITMTEQIFSC